MKEHHWPTFGNNILDSLKRWKFTEKAGKFINKLVETITWDKTEDDFWFHNTYDQSHDVIRRVSEGLPPSTSARDAYETMRLCFAAEQSADEKRAVQLDETLDFCC